MAFVENEFSKDCCDIHELEELKLSEYCSPGDDGEAGEFHEGDVREQITALLKVDGKGWNVAIFVDQKRLPICHECRHVCRDAVELGCDHSEDEIHLYCRGCLGDVIARNDGKCPIDSECEPIINRCVGQRKAILQSTVTCPYAAVHNATPDGSGSGSGCHFRGTLQQLIDGHLMQCATRSDPSYLLNLKMEALELRNTSLEKENASLKKTVQSLMFILCDSNASYYRDINHATRGGPAPAVGAPAKAKRDEYCKHQIVNPRKHPMRRIAFPETLVYIGRFPLNLGRDRFFAALAEIERKYQVRFASYCKMHSGRYWAYCFPKLQTKQMATKLMSCSPLTIKMNNNYQLCLVVNRSFAASQLH